MHRSAAALFVGCCLVVGVAAAVSGAAATDPAGLSQQDIDTDDVLLSIDVEESGDAVWEIEYRSRLATEEDEQAFEDLQADVEANPDEYRERFEERMESTAAEAAQATGREMSITEMTVQAERRQLPQEYGVLTYRFRWSNFAAVDDGRLVVGDAIEGLFLDDETTLLLSWPETHRLADTSPTPTETRERAVVWSGPIDFGSGEPRVTLEPEGGASTLPSGLVLGGALAAVVAGVAALLYRRRGGGSRDGTGEPGEPVAGTDRPEGDIAEEGDTHTDGMAGEDTADDDTDPSVDPDLLSNEERVLRFVEERGGRVKQQEIAQELDWTDAKTSQVTKQLREDGKLEGFRLGRENVLSLPETDDP
ncbi:MAG: hypothetical protein PPP58_01155 [Natronomonas sp.]